MKIFVIILNSLVGILSLLFFLLILENFSSISKNAAISSMALAIATICLSLIIINSCLSCCKMKRSYKKTLNLFSLIGSLVIPILFGDVRFYFVFILPILLQVINHFSLSKSEVTSTAPDEVNSELLNQRKTLLKRCLIFSSSLLLVILFFSKIFQHPLEGSYSNEGFKCACNHRGEITFRDGVIEMAFSVHKDIDGEMDILGTYQHLESNKYEISIDWEENQTTQVIHVNPERTLRLEVYNGEYMDLNESKFSLKEFISNLYWKWKYS